MTPLELVGVRVEIPANTPLLLLQEQGGSRRLLPIYIGAPEASAIHTAIEGVVPPRPLTHDLFVTVMGALGAELRQVVVTKVVDHTYHAQLHLRSANGDQTVSARPSDAVALAVRVGVPIYADDALLDAVGQLPDADDDDEADEIIDEFKDFIESVSPDDFAS